MPGEKDPPGGQRGEDLTVGRVTSEGQGGDGDAFEIDLTDDQEIPDDMLPLEGGGEVHVGEHDEVLMKEASEIMSLLTEVDQAIRHIQAIVDSGRISQLLRTDCPDRDLLDGIIDTVQAIERFPGDGYEHSENKEEVERRVDPYFDHDMQNFMMALRAGTELFKEQLHLVRIQRMPNVGKFVKAWNEYFVRLWDAYNLMAQSICCRIANEQVVITEIKPEEDPLVKPFSVDDSLGPILVILGNAVRDQRLNSTVVSVIDEELVAEIELEAQRRLEAGEEEEEEEEEDRVTGEFLYEGEELKHYSILEKAFPKLAKVCESIVIEGNPGVLFDRILNAINNPIKRRSLGAKNLSLSITKSKGTIRLQIRDDGKGMNREQLSTLFHPGVSGTRQEGGTGTGMAYADTILRSMNARMEIITREPGSDKVLKIDTGVPEMDGDVARYTPVFRPLPDSSPLDDAAVSVPVWEVQEIEEDPPIAEQGTLITIEFPVYEH